MQCPICYKKTNKVTDFYFFCASCDHWVSKLKNDTEAIKYSSPYQSFLEEGNNEEEIYFLSNIRLETSKIIINDLQGFGLGKLLDIGCASGLFLNVAIGKGFSAKGVEPNRKRASYALKKKIHVEIGFFPDILNKAERFKYITFNDVLEHIDDIEAMIKNCYRFLEPNGFLSINVPNSHGLFFKLSYILKKLGSNVLWDRLWQAMFYTPHIHYFSPKSLTNIVEKHNFIKVHGPKPLPVISFDNLWGRISAVPNTPYFVKLTQYFSFILLYPIYKISTKDSFFIVFQKK